MPINQVGRTRIGKFYELTDTSLGKGSFSKVYLAHHILFGNKVALKVIDRNQIEEDYVLKNLTREASILRKLKHPNIVNFYEDLSHKQLYCLSLELVEGCDLSNFLNRQPSRRLSEKFAKTLFYQMVSAVRYMHKANVLHRDLKQENILLEHEKVIKIVDFGLSNVRYPFKRLLTHCGSLEYAAPELFMHSSVYGPGVDLWSLGVILFSMVTGRMPFAVPRSGDGTCAPEHKDEFYRRISQGLTKENWKVMKNLSTDCCHLLENLLQPNQFKRSDIRDVYVHPWLQKDPNLKKTLPRFRPDLKHRYKTQVMNWMADKLGVPQRRIQVHLAIYKFETISAIYNMILDILVKKELYFPAHISNTLIFRMNHRERSHFYDIVGDSSLTAELCKDLMSKKIKTRQVVQTKDKIGDSESKESCQTRADDIPNQWGDGGLLTRRSKGSPILKSNHTFTKIDAEVTECFKMIGKKDTVILSRPIEDETLTLVKKPFRSYKYNRPLKAIKTSRDFEQNSLDWHNNSGKELKKDTIGTNENLDKVSISSSIALNYQRNLKLLNEKYRLKSHLPSKPIKNVAIKDVQNKQEWKRKTLSRTYESNNTYKGNKSFKPTNRNESKRNSLIQVDQLQNKEKQKIMHNLDSKSMGYNVLPKIFQLKPAFQDGTMHYPAAQKEHFQKTTVYYNKSGTNYCQFSQGNCSSRGNPQYDAYASIPQNVNDFNKKPKFHPRNNENKNAPMF